MGKPKEVKNSGDFEREIERLTGELAQLEGELAIVREARETEEGQKAVLLTEVAKLGERLGRLEKELEDANRAVTALVNDRRELTGKFEQLRAYAAQLNEQIEQIAGGRRPSVYGVFVRITNPRLRLVDVWFGGMLRPAIVMPFVNPEYLKTGMMVALNNEGGIVGLFINFPYVGTEAYFDSWVDAEAEGGEPRWSCRRLRAANHQDSKQVFIAGEAVRNAPLKPGTPLLIVGDVAVAVLEKGTADSLFLEEVPDVSYADIGGLDTQITDIRDLLEKPLLHPERAAKFQVPIPKGVLLYGPPGCGKTMIAKAIAKGLGELFAERLGKAAKGYFISIKGPELLTKWVGETERKIREIFETAKEHAKENLVVIFFDEGDSFLRQRGLGISSDMEQTIVPQFCSMVDGLEALRNVVVIVATNRADLIDPAVLRPGRLDVKIEVKRPDKKGVRDICLKYLTPDLPFHPRYFDPSNYEGENYMPRDHTGAPRKERYSIGRDTARLVEYLADRAVAWLFDDIEKSKFLKVTYGDGKSEVLYFKDFVSGAVIANIVTRAKRRAFNRSFNDEGTGIELADIYYALQDEFRENKDLPNTTQGIADWLKLQGKGSRHVLQVDPLLEEKNGKKTETEKVSTGQYL
ncbi:MAG: AAA family ATPase [bacterium]|nr:AAA family ATPase [bacterium]